MTVAPATALAHAPSPSAAPAAPAAEPPPPYDLLAPVYQLLTGDYGYDRWVGVLEGLARDHGLTGSRALDVACGDGNAILPLLELGYDVTGCDLAPAMVERADARAGGRARLLVADMRALPLLGRFDLVTCLGDVFNHLDASADLRAALGGMRQNLRPGGMVVFDVNLLAAYRDVPDVVIDGGEHMVTWSGRGALIDEPGGAGTVIIDVFQRDGDVWRRSRCRQPHRHHPLDVVRAAVAAAGLEVVAIRGQRPGAQLDAEADESVHPKAVVLARRPERMTTDRSALARFRRARRGRGEA
jgi:SAM-dependent methyltransferase